MENCIDRLKKYKPLIDEFFDETDFESVANSCRITVKTIKNYLNGKIPSSPIGELTENNIIKHSLIILEEKKRKLELI